MKDYKKAIEEAARKYKSTMLYDGEFNAFTTGALSPEAKAFHTQGMYSEEEAMNLAYQLWEGFLHETKEYPNFDIWFNDNKKK